MLWKLYYYKNSLEMIFQETSLGFDFTKKSALLMIFYKSQ